MQREIASVMAACGLRSIRYVTFPPVVFETPAPAALPESLPPEETGALPLLVEHAGAPLPAEAALAPVAFAAQEAPVAVPVPATPVPAAPVPAALMQAAPAAPTPIPVEAVAAPFLPPAAAHAPAPAPRPGMRRLAEFAAEMAPTGRPRRGAQPQVPPHGPPRYVVSEAEAPSGPAPSRDFALLQDVAHELRPRRARARTGKRA